MQLSTTLLGLSLAIQAMAAPSPVELSKRVTHVGRATPYEQFGVAGSCGEFHSDSDKILALSAQWDVKSFCGRKVSITNKGGPGAGRTVVATVEDTCPGCDVNHLDLSHGTFQALTGGSLEPFPIEWHFCNVSGQC